LTLKLNCFNIFLKLRLKGEVMHYVLICESDYKENVFRRALNGQARIVFAQSKPEAREKRPWIKPAVIVVDAWLKGNGSDSERPDLVRESAKLVREFHESHPRVPIVATGFSDSSRQELVDAGADVMSDSIEQTIRLIERYLRSAPDPDDDD